MVMSVFLHAPRNVLAEFQRHPQGVVFGLSYGRYCSIDNLRT